MLASAHPAKIDRERTEAGTCRRGGDTRGLPGMLGTFHIFPMSEAYMRVAFFLKKIYT